MSVIKNSFFVAVGYRAGVSRKRKSCSSCLDTPNPPPRWEDTVILVVEADPDED